MKFRIFTIFILTSSYAFGQETVLKEKRGEAYYVLKDNPEVKHGLYQNSSKKRLIEKGEYDHNKKIGVWEFYDDQGNLEQKYDYTSNQLIFNKERKQFGIYKLNSDGNLIEIEPDMHPLFIGGRARYDRFIKNNLKYPKNSKSKGTEGRQIVIVLLSKQGEILEKRIYRPISADIDEEALRLINELPKEWIPAKHQNEAIDVIVGLPVLFRLN